MSALNCKPGDLAIVVSGRPVENLGRVIRVIEIKPIAYLMAWSFEGDLLDVDMVDDSCLKPLRDPGDDARDETLMWLPVPSTTKEAA